MKVKPDLLPWIKAKMTKELVNGHFLLVKSL